jgi:hypothetical protein
MIFFSIGLPSRFAEWCDGVATRLVETALGPADLISANTLEEIGLAAVRAHGGHLVIGARQPAEGLRAALTAAQCGFIVALDDPRAALHNLAVRHGLEWKAATRATATSCASIANFALMPDAVVLRADEVSRDPIAAAGLIARCLGLELDASDIAACAGSTAAVRPDTAEDAADPWWDQLATADREIAGGALTGYAEYFSGQRLGQLIWARDLFFLGDDPTQCADRVIDLAGGIRNLLFGPYIALPPGAWTTTVTLAVSRDAAGMSLGVEVIAGPRCVCLCHTSIVPDERGLCQANLAFTVDASTDQPIQLRVANLLPASSGRLALGQVVLTAQTGAHVEIPAELSTALGL